MNKFFRDVSRTLLPQMKCAICGNKVGKDYVGFCDECVKKLNSKRESMTFCNKCCSFIDKDDTCPHNSEENRYIFDNGWALYPYKDDVKKIVHNFKYNGAGYLSYGMAKLMYNYMDKAVFNNGNYDLLVPVPLFKKKERERGYNQSRLLGEDLAKFIGIPVDFKSLFRKKDTTSQTRLSATERHNNMSMAFDIQDSSNISKKRIILLDDVITTGSTANACCEQLKIAGAVSVTFVSFAASAREK